MAITSPEAKERWKVHGVWAQLVSRCTDPKNPGYHNYGGRGITVSQDWMTFANFYRDMAPRPLGGMIDRIDNNAGYSKTNCKWSSRQEQNSNRRNCIMVDLDGEKITLKEACRRKGLVYRAVHKRITMRGWDVVRALSTPIGEGNKHASN